MGMEHRGGTRTYGIASGMATIVLYTLERTKHPSPNAKSWHRIAGCDEGGIKAALAVHGAKHDTVEGPKLRLA